jgi:F0F1-type ATP synthase assembly protein I
MHEAIVSPLAAWESFYVITGSSAAALTGLQFVVIALVAEGERQSSRREIDAFGTPTIVHFCSVLLLAAILTAPWQELSNAGLALGLTGLAGVLYVAIVTRRARRQSGYKPVFEDWLWHTILPFLAYAGIAVTAIRLQGHPAPMLFVIGAAALLLLFIGIHNSWDTVTYIAIDLRSRKPSP